VYTSYSPRDLRGHDAKFALPVSKFMLSIQRIKLFLPNVYFYTVSQPITPTFVPAPAKSRQKSSEHGANKTFVTHE